MGFLRSFHFSAAMSPLLQISATLLIMLSVNCFERWPELCKQGPVGKENGFIFALPSLTMFHLPNSVPPPCPHSHGSVCPFLLLRHTFLTSAERDSTENIGSHSLRHSHSFVLSASDRFLLCNICVCRRSVPLTPASTPLVTFLSERRHMACEHTWIPSTVTQSPGQLCPWRTP